MTTQTNSQIQSVDGLSAEEIKILLLEKSSEDLKEFFKTETGRQFCCQLSNQMNHLNRSKRENRGLRNCRFDSKSPETARLIVHGHKSELINLCSKFGFDLQKMDYLSPSTATGMVCYEVFTKEETEED